MHSKLKIKLIATDLDGTLLDKDERVPQAFFRQIEQLHELGIKVAIASGRQIANIRKLFGNYAPYLHFIGDNGALGIHEEKVFHQSFLDWESTFKLIEQGKNIPGVIPLVSAENHTYFEDGKKEDVAFISQFYSNCAIVKSFDDIDTDKEQPLKVAYYDKLGVKENSLTKFKSLEGIKATQSNVKWLDIASTKSHKGAAIETLQTKYGISKDETMSFGDFHNDIDMLNQSKFSFAVAGAQEEVKEAASYMTLSNNEEGVCHILQKLVDNQKDTDIDKVFQDFKKD